MVIYWLLIYPEVMKLFYKAKYQLITLTLQCNNCAKLKF